MEGVVKFVVLCVVLWALFFGVSCNGRRYQVACNQQQGVYLSQ